MGSPDENKNNNNNDSNYFEPISMIIIPMMNYEYTIVANDFYNTTTSFGESDFTSAGLSLSSLPNEIFCSIYNVQFNLKYATHCLTSPKNCTPFDSSIDNLSRVMMFKVFECYEKQQRLKILIKFPSDNQNMGFFSQNSVLIGEGMWDAKNNQINIVACRFSDVGIVDCSTKLSLKYPAIWKIGKMYRMDGYIWTNKTVEEIGYFDKIRLTSYDALMPKGLKYEYTKIDKLMKLCPRRGL